VSPDPARGARAAVPAPVPRAPAGAAPGRRAAALPPAAAAWLNGTRSNAVTRSAGVADTRQIGEQPLPIRCTSTSRTDPGKVRSHNEDACLERPDTGLWAVADGMGGHAAGDVASRLVIERLGALGDEPRLSRFVDQVESALEEANEELRRLAASREASAIGSTVAALLVRGEHAVCAWVGDSRIYRIRGGVIEQITQDHALVADLVDRGVLTAEQAVGHPHANLVTRAVGAAERLLLDLEILHLEPGDRFVLCSDGLDKELADDEILAAAGSARGGDLADTLVELALSRGSRDNVTVVAVHVEADGDDAGDESEDTLPGFTAGARER